MATHEYANVGTGIAGAINSTRIFFKIKNKYDVIHFNFGRTLLDYPRHGLSYLDLPFYRGAKFMTFNGSDARQPMPASYNPYSPFLTKEYHGLDPEIISERIRTLFEHISFGFALNPDLMNFLPPGKSMFLPYVKQSWFDSQKSDRKRGEREFVIVHAPTNRQLKGTEMILQHVDQLSKSYPIRMVLVEGMSHAEAKKRYAQADLMIDQVRLGWYGGVAVEAMKMGVPVAVYVNPADLKFIPLAMRNAIPDAFLEINPDNIYEPIAELIENPVKYGRLASAAYDYVNTFHDPDKLVKLVIEKYEEFCA